MNRAGVSECLLLSEAAYLTRFEAADMASTIGAKLLYVFRVAAVHCYVFQKEGTLFFATRGTDITSLVNIVLDTRILPRWDKEVGIVHRGFYIWADLLWEDVLDVLKREGSAADRIVFCGHSAGGAASTLLGVKAAAVLAKHGGAKPYVVTFGAPMVGTILFSSKVSSMTNHIRVTNNNDPVPHLPFWPVYTHPGGTRYHIMADGEIMKNPVMLSLIKDVPHGLFYFLWTFFKEMVRTKSILLAVVNSLRTGDHFIRNYKGYFR